MNTEESRGTVAVFRKKQSGGDIARPLTVASSTTQWPEAALDMRWHP